MPPIAPAKNADKKPVAAAPAPTKPTATAASAKAPAKKKAVAPTPPPAIPTNDVAQPASDEVQRPIIYPIVKAEVCTGSGAIDEAFAKQALEWETEKEFVSRMMLQNPGSQAKSFEYGDVYMLKDEEDNKVRCLNNLDNRWFDEAWCRSLAQGILRFQWAGALTIPDKVTAVYGNKHCSPVTIDGKIYNPGDTISVVGGTVNGSTIVISRTGKMESGQHSCCALVLACQIYRAAAKGTYPQWDAAIAAGLCKGPVIETILVTGVSEDRRVIMTVDNCKPRSEADVLYTSELFVKLRDQPAKRKEMARMTQACFDLFWKRTATKGYKTHAEMRALIERHPKLLKAVEHLFAENAAFQAPSRATNLEAIINGKGRPISNLNLSAGQSACLCYLMGCSASDGDAYRNGNPPREKGLDWSRWDAAKDFWAMIGTSPAFDPVRIALGNLVGTSPDSDTNTGLGGRLSEKLAILAKAWKVFVEERQSFTTLDLEPGGCLYLNYTKPTTVNGKFTPAALVEDAADFGGIDVPSDDKPEEGEQAPPSKVDLSKRAEELRLQKAKETADKIKQMRLSQDGRPVVPATVAKK